MATLRALFADGNIVAWQGYVFNNGGVTVFFTGEISDEMDPAEGIEIGPGKMAHLKPKSGKWVRFEPYEIEVLDV